MKVPELTLVPSEVRCAKPGCPVTSHTELQRHHRGHEAMWLGIWRRSRGREAKFRAFVRRYHQFCSTDVVLICSKHHAEIHSIYDKIINDFRKQVGFTLANFSWSHAEQLMNKLRTACDEWMVKETPGLDPSMYNQTKSIHRALLRKGFRIRS